MTIADFDHLDAHTKKKLLLDCCGSSDWVKSMMNVFPVEDLVDLLEYAEEKWYECSPADWMEAFEHHPKIGDAAAIKNNEVAASEQSGIEDATNDTLEKLAKGNEQYEEEFGYRYIVCAQGRSAEEMVDDLTARLKNDPHEELSKAAAEQFMIMKLRLEKLFS